MAGTTAMAVPAKAASAAPTPTTNRLFIRLPPLVSPAGGRMPTNG
jgi:hypothetical protein